MIKIVRKLKKNKFKPSDYYIYKKEEFDGNYSHWKECEPGDWGISDDGYIAECLERNKYATSTEMVFPYGRQWISKTARLEFEAHYTSGNFANVSTRSYNELEAARPRTELAIDAYLMYKLSGELPDLEKIGKIYRPDQKNPIIAAKRMLKIKEVKKIMKEKLQEILIEKKIDEGYVLDVMKDAVDVAKSKEDPANMIRAAKELGEYLDMKPKAKQLTESVEVDISHQIKDSYEKQTKKLKATKIQEIQGNEEDDHYHKIKG